MSKPTYEVWVRTLDDQMSMANPENKSGVYDTLGEAESFALDLTDSDKVKYVYVVQRRVSMTLKGKGLLIKESKGDKLDPPTFEGFEEAGA